MKKSCFAGEGRGKGCRGGRCHRFILLTLSPDKWEFPRKKKSSLFCATFFFSLIFPSFRVFSLPISPFPLLTSLYLQILAIWNSFWSNGKVMLERWKAISSWPGISRWGESLTALHQLTPSCAGGAATQQPSWQFGSTHGKWFQMKTEQLTLHCPLPSAHGIGGHDTTCSRQSPSFKEIPSLKF